MDIATKMLELFAVWYGKEPCICQALDWQRREHGNQHAPDCHEINAIWHDKEVG